MLEGADYYANVYGYNLVYRVIRGFLPKDNFTATLEHAYFLQVRPVGCTA